MKNTVEKRQKSNISIFSKATSILSVTGFMLKELFVLPFSRFYTENHYGFKNDLLVRVLTYAMSMDFDRFRFLFIASSRMLPWAAPVEECVHGHWIGPKIDFKDPNSMLIIYVHGGGYCVGDSLQYMDTFHYIITAMNRPTRILSLDYPLAPESSHPAQLEFFLNAYQDLLESVNPNQIVLMGESAGGHCILNGLAHLCKNDIQLPTAAVAISPWANPTQIAEDYPDCPNDYVLPGNLEKMAFSTFGVGFTSADVNILKTPASILKKLFPKVKLLVTYGGVETLADQVLEYVELVKSSCGQGVLTLDVDEEMPHIYQCLPLLFGKNSKDGLDRIIDWMTVNAEEHVRSE